MIFVAATVFALIASRYVSVDFFQKEQPLSSAEKAEAAAAVPATGG